MNAQEVFDKVWDHFVTQKQPLSYIVAKTEGQGAYAACQYRGPNGISCAAGLFLAEWAYQPQREGFAASTYAVKVPGCFGEAGPHLELLDRLQGAHDDAAGHAYDSRGANEATLALLKRKLADVATSFNLTVPA